MILPFLAIIGIALLFYVLVPLLEKGWNKQKEKRIIKDLQTYETQKPNQNTYLFTETKDKVLHAQNCFDTNKTILIPLKTTHFFTLRLDKESQMAQLQPLSIKNLFTMEKEERLWCANLNERTERFTCVILDSPKFAETSTIFAKIRTDKVFPQTAKYWSIALGVFFEFLILTQLLKTQSLNLLVFSVIIAIFGKALPYLPPGLICTLLSQKLFKSNETTSIKTEHTNNLARILLYIAGILLNIALLLSIFRYLGIN